MTFPFRSTLSAAAVALALAAPAAQATTVTVQLEDADLENRAYIQDELPGFGSDGEVTLNWNPLNDSNKSLRHWNGEYSFRDAAYCNEGVGCALDLTVASGFSITLDSFWLGGYINTARQITWSVIDLADDAEVAGAEGAFVSGTTGLTNAISKTSTAGFRILFGPDGFNGGINDIVYTYFETPDPVDPVDPVDPSVIPLPAAGWLLLAGLGGLAAVRRRRT